MSSEPGVLEAAIRRLEQATGQLEVRYAAVAQRAEAGNGELFDADRARLAADLDAAKGRERELETAGLNASRALGRAITTIRAALGEEAAEALKAGDLAAEELAAADLVVDASMPEAEL